MNLLEGLRAGITSQPLSGSPVNPSAVLALNQMHKVNLSLFLTKTCEVVIRAGELLTAEWAREGGLRGEGDKAIVDVEIESILRHRLLGLLDCDFWGEETGYSLTGNAWCWVNARAE